MRTIQNFRSRTQVVNGVKLHYWIGGPENGLPIILWHGNLGTAYAWRRVAPRLAEAGFSVLVPDMRGYGDSDKPEGVKGYDARALSEECRSLVQAIQFGQGERAIFAAHDMGALPALIWTADHPDEVAGLLYIEAPVMLGAILRKIISYTPESMAEGSMWWWILPLAPGVAERLIVGNERAFLTWFYDRHTVNTQAINDETIKEYLRTFVGREGVLGSMGIYRAAFTSIAQTEPLMLARIKTPVIAMGGREGLGAKVAEMVRLIAENVTDEVLKDSGHFIPEEQPEAVVRQVLMLSESINGSLAREGKTA